MRIAAMAAGAVGGYFGARMAAAGHDVTSSRAAHCSKRSAGTASRSRARSATCISRRPTRHPIRRRSGRSISCCSRSSFGTPRPPPKWRAHWSARNPRHHFPEWRRQRGAHRADPRRRADGRRQRLHRQRDGLAGRDFAHQPVRPDGVRPRSTASPTRKLDAFADAAKKAGIDITVSPAMDVERWQKFVFLVGLSGATAAMRMPLGAILADPDTREFLHRSMREVVAVGRAKGVAHRRPTSPTTG